MVGGLFPRNGGDAVEPEASDLGAVDGSEVAFDQRGPVRIRARGGVAAGGDVSGNAFGDGSVANRIDTFVLNFSQPTAPRSAGILPAPRFPTLPRRQELTDAVVSALTDPADRVVVTLEGLPGSGKSVLAAHVCEDPRLSAWATRDPAWIAVGQSRRGAVLAEFIGDICEALGGRRPATSDPELAGAALGETLDETGQDLLVIDDVWYPEQVAPFLRGAEGCARLFTTRTRGVVPLGSSIDVGPLTTSDAAMALAAGLGDVLPGQLDPLLDFAAGWALVIGLMNATMRSNVQAGGHPREVASWMVRLLSKGGVTSLTHEAGGSLHRTLEASLSLLGNADRARYLEIGIFRDDVLVPGTTIMDLWQASADISPGSASSLLNRIVDLRLAELTWLNGEPHLTLHDLLRGYLREQLGKPGLFHANNAMVSSWAREVPRVQDEAAWWELEESDYFIIEQLPEHLRGAGRLIEIERLLTDFRWVELQVRTLGSALSTVAALEYCASPVAHALRGFLTNNLDVLLPDHRRTLTSTLLGRAMAHRELDNLVERRITTVDFPLVLPHWMLPDHDYADRIEHTGPIGDCALSPDGTLLATASDDGLVIIWDAESIEPIRALRGHRQRARSCSFSPDSLHLLSTGMDGTLRVWRVRDGEPIRVMGDRRSRVLGSAWSHDGTRVASADTLGRVAVWDPWTGHRLQNVDSPSAYEWACSFSVDDSHLASCGEDGILRVWDLSSGKMIHSIPVLSGRLRCCVFLGERIVVAGDDGLVAIVDLSTSTVTQRFTGHVGRVRWCAVSPDGSQIASAGEDRTVRLWAVDTAKEFRRFAGHSDWVGGCTFAPSGTSIYSCGGDGSVRRWRTDSDQPAISRVGESVPAECCSGSSDRSLVAAGYADGSVAVHSVEDGAETLAWQAHDGRVFGLAETCGEWLTAGGDGLLRRWADPNTGKVSDLQRMGRLWSCAASDYGWAWVSENGDAGYIDRSGQPSHLIAEAHSGAALGCQLSRDGSMLATTGDDSTVRVWDVKDGALLTTLTSNQDVAFWACDFSPSGELLVAVGEPNGVMCGWYLPSGALSYSVSAGRGRVSGCAVSPAGDLVATCGEDGLVELRRVVDGGPVAGVRVAAPLRRLSWIMHDDVPLLAAAGAAGVYMFKVVD